MKYTYIDAAGDQITVEINDKEVRGLQRSLGISFKEAAELWLCDEGVIENEEQKALQAKAAGKVGAKASSGKRTVNRKPDMIKRAMIEGLAEYLNGTEAANVEVTNIERVIRFTFGEDTYEVTLSKKRKPKS